ncbi:HD domain-containing protein [Hespellia stercorisuis]|nr:HD domain-containing protein [Hespellia stercorisuis]
MEEIKKIKAADSMGALSAAEKKNAITSMIEKRNSAGRAAATVKTGGTEMERVNRILQNRIYRSCLQKIEECEKERIFCRHDMTHFLDVARLAYILNLEESCGIKKDCIYACALLHDVGRHIQYTQNVPHEQAGLPIASDIMQECGFKEPDREMILDAIANHRNAEIKGERNLKGLLYRADKMSRICFACKAQDECYKVVEKRRMEL